MNFGGLHTADLAVILAYLAAVLVIGLRSARKSTGEEGFFLAGRSLGKLYQFFLNFGNATEPQGAVSTASFVYQQGAPGSWLSFQTVFMNPYFWFMNVWFRRVRLTTLADLFEDRFDSRSLSICYAFFQILVACVFLGFSNVTAYRIASTLVLKPEAEWSAAERASVDGYREYKVLSAASANGKIDLAGQTGLALLRERDSRNELHSYVTLLNKTAFYAVFSLVIGAYIVMGGMSAAAANEGLQSVLIIVFSVILIPAGLHAIGGWQVLSRRVPAQMFDLFGSSGSNQFTLAAVGAILLVSIVQNAGLSHNMGICGSARNEFAARSGVSGNYLKRIMVITWAFVGLLAVAIFTPTGLSDPDAAWGSMSKLLLHHGLVGLMLAGVLAGTMSTLAAKALAISSLFVRNVFRPLRPAMTQRQSVFCARCMIAVVLALGAAAAACMGSFLSILNIILTVNIPFGAAVLLIFWWRRVTAKSVWACVILSTLLIIIIPWSASSVPAIADSAALSQMSTRPGIGVFFDAVVHRDPDDLSSPLVAKAGFNRFNLEAWLASKAGFAVAELSPNERFTLQFAFDGIFPFVVLLVVSKLTRPTEAARVARFYGKMKTPVGATRELDALALEETARRPDRFDHTKLRPRSNWEFCRWDRTDAVGFAICTALSGALMLFFMEALKFVARG